MSTTIGTVTINRNPSVQGTRWHKERMNQASVMAADGTLSTYDQGPTMVRGTLVLRHVAKSEAASLVTYLEDTAIWQKNSFTIAPPDNTDLGAGDGVDVTVYYDGGNSFDGVFEPDTNNALFVITLPYFFVES